MVRNAALLALVPTVGAITSFNGNRNFLGADMRPDVVAHTLAKVEDGWMHQATKFARCMVESGECEESAQSFSKSCTQVVNGIVQGSSGEKDRTAEYMADVCGQKALSGWHTATCVSLSKSLAEKMTDSAFDNREQLKTVKICDETWTDLVEVQKKEVAKMLAKRDAEQKAAKEEAAKAAEAKKLAQKKEAEEAIKEAAEVEKMAETKEKELKAQDEQQKKVEKKSEKAEADSFQKTKSVVESVEEAAERKLKEADALEHEDDAPVVEAPKAAPVAKAAPAAPKPSAVKVAVSAAPAAPKPAVVKVAAVAKDTKPVELKAAVPTKNTKVEVKIAKPTAAKEVKPAAAKEVKPAVQTPKA